MVNIPQTTVIFVSVLKNIYIILFGVVFRPTSNVLVSFKVNPLIFVKLSSFC